MSYLTLTLVLGIAAAVCAYLWQTSQQGQQRFVAGVAAVGFGALASLNALSWLASLSRRLVTLAMLVVIAWAIFKIATSRT